MTADRLVKVIRTRKQTEQQNVHSHEWRHFDLTSRNSKLLFYLLVSGKKNRHMLCLKSWLKLWMLLPSRIERKTCDFALKSCQFNSCFPQAVYAGYWLVIVSRSSLQIKLMWKALVIFLFSFWEGATSWLFASTVKMDSWRTWRQMQTVITERDLKTKNDRDKNVTYLHI